MWASVQTVRGCPKHCSFCSVWRTDGQKPRQRGADAVIEEIVELRRRGFRFIALADDNFYPVTLDRHPDGRAARRPGAAASTSRRLRAERFELMEQLAKLPDDMVFFTQITMEAAEDPEFLDAMQRGAHQGRARRRRGGDARRAEGRLQGLQLRRRDARRTAARVQGRTASTCSARSSSGCRAIGRRHVRRDARESPQRAGVTFAQFVMLTPFPGTVDFAAWEKTHGADTTRIGGVPLTRHWLIPQAQRPKVYTPHPVMDADEIRRRTQAVWDRVLQPAEASGSDRAASSR